MDTATINSTAYFERLLAHFFSDHRLQFNEADCKWFLRFSNQSDAASGIDVLHANISINVLKFYLSKILGTGKDESLGMFMPRVSSCTYKTHLVCI